MNNQEALDKVIANLIAKLEETEVGSEEHKALVDAIAKLEDRSLEIERIQIDAVDKEKAREREFKNDILEHNLKCEQMENERKNEVVKHIITIGTTVVTVIVTIWGVRVSLKFEEQGTITTTVGRSMFNSIINFFRKK